MNTPTRSQFHGWAQNQRDLYKAKLLASEQGLYGSKVVADTNAVTIPSGMVISKIIPIGSAAPVVATSTPVAGHADLDTQTLPLGAQYPVNLTALTLTSGKVIVYFSPAS